LVKGVAPQGQLFTKMEIFDFLAAAFPPLVAIDRKFCRAKRTQVPVGPAKFDLNGAKNLIFGL